MCIRDRDAGMTDDILKVLISEEELRSKVKELGAKISADYAGRCV